VLLLIWTTDQQQIIAFLGKYEPGNGGAWRDKIPLKYRRFKCFTCKVIWDFKDLVDGKCPKCGEELSKFESAVMCPLDHCNCIHTHPMSGIEYCPVCNDPICPECGTHDVIQISRVTGYLSDVGGWHAGKQQELKDRTRYNMGVN
jgi:hypothetical protein